MLAGLTSPCGDLNHVYRDCIQGHTVDFAEISDRLKRPKHCFSTWVTLLQNIPLNECGTQVVPFKHESICSRSCAINVWNLLSRMLKVESVSLNQERVSWGLGAISVELWGASEGGYQHPAWIRDMAPRNCTLDPARPFPREGRQ